MAMPSSIAMVLNSLARRRRAQSPRDQLAQVLQMDVAGNKLSEELANGDDGLAEVAVLHPGGAPKAARSGHIASMRRGS